MISAGIFRAALVRFAVGRSSFPPVQHAHRSQRVPTAGRAAALLLEPGPA